MEFPDALAQKFAAIRPSLNERGLRRWAAAEARSLGHGGIKRLVAITGLARGTIERGIRELNTEKDHPQPLLPSSSSRRKGGGRKKLTVKCPELSAALNALVDPVTRGHPESALIYSSKSAAKLCSEMQAMGYQISERATASLLKEMGYSLQAMRKTMEGGTHEHRDAQSENIAKQVAAYQAAGQPAVSIDAKKKELVGPFANKGKEWEPC